MRDRTYWDEWNRSGGPNYPHGKVVQFLFRRFGSAALRQRKKVLDLGCGSGVHMLFLAREGFDAHGLDLSPVGVANTRARLASAGLAGEVTTGSVDSIPWPDASFDALICIGVLDAAGPDLLTPALAEIVRVLRPGAAALLLFASDADVRLHNGNVAGLHGFDDDTVEAAIAPLLPKAHIWRDRYITTFENRRIRNDEHILTLARHES